MTQPPRPTGTVEGSLPADHLTPAETRRALLIAAIAWGVFGSAWMNLIGGAPFVNYARRLGASTFMFGLLNSLPFLGVLAQLPTSYIIERVGRRKPLFLACGLVQRSLWFAAAAIWAIPREYAHLRVGALLAVLMLSSTLGNASMPAWISWFADFVPVQIRGRYLGNRAALATLTGVVTSGAAGWVLDQTGSFTAFTVIFCVAAVFGLMDIVLFLGVRETAMAKREAVPHGFLRLVLEPLGSPPFRRYLAYAFSESFMFAIAGPFFWLMALEGLKIGNFWSNFYIMIVPMVCTAVTLPLWGSACDRFGSRPLVSLGTFMTIIWPICWLLATHSHFHALLAVSAIVGGGFSAAVLVADMNMLMGLTPRAGRPAYIAVLSVAAALGMVLAPTISGAVAQELKDLRVVIGGRAFGSFHVLMAASLLARLAHVFLVVPRLPDTPTGTTGSLVRHLLSWPVRRLSALFWRPEY
ncbi:MAG: MFS transporter [Armatimonadota bacterium]